MFSGRRGQPSSTGYSFKGRYHVESIESSRTLPGLAEECRAIAALCTPSTEMRTHYWRMAEHYSSLAATEELGALADGGNRFDSSGLAEGGSRITH
jgi:hypothetical protein